MFGGGVRGGEFAVEELGQVGLEGLDPDLLVVAVSTCRRGGRRLSASIDCWKPVGMPLGHLFGLARRR